MVAAVEEASVSLTRIRMGESPRKRGPDERSRALLEQQCKALERLVNQGEKMQQRGVAPITASYRNVPVFAQRQGQSRAPHMTRPFRGSISARYPSFRPRFVQIPLAIPRAVNAHHRVWRKRTETYAGPSVPARPSTRPFVVPPVVEPPTLISIPPPPINPGPSTSTGFSGPIRPIVKLNSRTRFRLVEDRIAAKLLKEEKEKLKKLSSAKSREKPPVKYHPASKYRLDRRVPKLLAKSVTLGGLNLVQRRSLLKNPRARLSSSFSIQRFSLQRRKKLSITELDLNLSAISQQLATPIRLATRFVKRSKQQLCKKQKSNKPCVFFVRTGVCRRQEGKCPFEHNPAKRLLCQRYLKNGICDANDCTLSHDKENGRLPPPCRFYRRGVCTKNAGECPFAHSEVKGAKRRPSQDKKEKTQSTPTEEPQQGRYFEMHPDSQPEEAVIPRRLPKGCHQEVSVKCEEKVGICDSPDSSTSSSEDNDKEVMILEQKKKARAPPTFIGFRR